MALRIGGVILPEHKPAYIALSYLYGVGPSSARKILAKAGVQDGVRVKTLTAEQADKIRQITEAEFKLENQLRQEIATNIRRLKEIGTYRGLRHSKNLPVRGQRTRTNARTKRGKKVTVGSGRKKASEKT
ncbi:30S ribosomal protein S13 [Candidatus Berkelbacteria bacterium]|nr:30S ribosomal protein S13 [Candidatus Berkelbacteria bacterium]